MKRTVRITNTPCLQQLQQFDLDECHLDATFYQIVSAHVSLLPEQEAA